MLVDYLTSKFLADSWRRSLKSLCPILFVISLVTVLIVNNLTPATAQIPRQEIRGVWMTNNDFNTLKSHSKLLEAVTQLRRLNFNTIYPVIWNSGYVLYPSTVAKNAGIQPFVFRGEDGQDILADLIEQAHRQGLLVIPWFEFGLMAPPTSELASNYPHWFTQKQDGSQTSITQAGEVMWLNPFYPQVRHFITKLILELVTKYNIDGIQFDDHMSLPQAFGYDHYTLRLYTRETQNSLPRNPEAQEWIDWRADHITALMEHLTQTIKAEKPNLIISVAPNYYDFAYKFQLQDWLTWVQLGIVDELVVQVYRPNLQDFTNIISRPEIQRTQKIIPTSIGIMAGLRNNPVPMAQIQSQVRATRERGLGVVFFYYESLWNSAPETLTQRQAGFQYLFPYPALRARL
jgi:uncharacterized lipoprotein YddW (UPF0748 family)